jgi:hypothetical protein
VIAEPLIALISIDNEVESEDANAVLSVTNQMNPKDHCTLEWVEKLSHH